MVRLVAFLVVLALAVGSAMATFGDLIGTGLCEGDCPGPGRTYAMLALTVGLFAAAARVLRGRPDD